MGRASNAKNRRRTERRRLGMSREEYQMAISDFTVKRVDIPHEPGEWIEIKKITEIEVRIAEQAKTDRVYSSFDAMPAKIVDAVFSRRDSGEANLKANPDALTVQEIRDRYDVLTLLEKSIVNWSYKFPEKNPDGSANPQGGNRVPVTREWLEKVDVQTAWWMADEIVQLFSMTDDDQKNDSSPSNSSPEIIEGELVKQ